MGDLRSFKCIYQSSTLHKDMQALALKKLKLTGPIYGYNRQTESNSITQVDEEYQQPTWGGFFAAKFFKCYFKERV